MSVSSAAQTVAAAGDKLSAAHARLLADRTLQFAFEAARSPPPPPGWLRALGRWLLQAGPAMKWVFWALLCAGALLIAALLIREFWFYRPGRRRKLGKASPPATDWRPDPARARALLADADGLAAEGRFAEAARVLLHRSVADIDDRRPDLLGPALTSRDIAALPRLAEPVRRAFARISGVVERGLFAGRPIDATDWAECRGAYEALALPEAWTGRASA